MIKSIKKINYPVTYLFNWVINKGIAIEERVWKTEVWDSIGILVKWITPIKIGCHIKYEEFFHGKRLQDELIKIN